MAATHPQFHDVHNVDKYEHYAARYDPDWAEDRRHDAARRRGGKKSQQEIISELAEEAEGLEAGFITTYQPARYEGPFLLEAIRPFYDLDLIVDVLANVKGGKEANVYRCRADPALGVEYLAAKVYRPRRFRNLRNDKMYREGRALLLAGGREVKANERRIVHAVQKRTEFGLQVAHSSWLMYEYTTLEKLHRAGAHTPKPFAVSDNAILMQYIGDGTRRAYAAWAQAGAVRGAASVRHRARRRGAHASDRRRPRRPVGLQHSLLGGGDHVDRLSPGHGHLCQRPCAPHPAARPAAAVQLLRRLRRALQRR